MEKGDQNCFLNNKGMKLVLSIYFFFFFVGGLEGEGGGGGFYFIFGGLEVRISLFYSFSYCWGLGTTPSFLVLEF